MSCLNFKLNRVEHDKSFLALRPVLFALKGFGVALSHLPVNGIQSLCNDM